MKVRDRNLKRCFVITAIFFLVAAGALAAFLMKPFDGLSDAPAAAVLTDCEGGALRVWLGRGGMDCRPSYQPQRRDWISRAIVAAEDKRFWSHHGVDPWAVIRAMRQDLLHGRVVSGASTLSMQVMRMDRPRARTLWAKVMEASRALRMERVMTKDEILTEYLRRAPFGGNVVGIEAASQRYFGKSPGQLSLAEAALLAGLPQSPSRYRPDRNLSVARKRQAYVLDRMEDCGMISLEERNKARAQSVTIRRTPYPFRAPHFCDLMASELAGRSRGEVYRTTLNPHLQEIAEDTVRRYGDDLAARDIQGVAAVILEVRTGALRALVGSPDFFARRGQVNAALSPRSAGSTLKPFAYALAFDRGLLTPGMVLADVPRQFADCTPANFDPTYRGLVPAREALALSLNMPALGVEEKIGLGIFYQQAWDLGLHTLDQGAEHYGLGLVLGNGPVRLLELANAYACLARGGWYQPIRLLEDSDVESGRRLFSPAAAWLVTDALSGDERGVAITGHDADVHLPRLAWKTGTSAGYHDGWTVAYNPEYVVAVWVGNPDGRPSENLVGRLSAAPVAWDIFRQLYPDNVGPWLGRPTGVRSRTVCADSGCPPGPYCRRLSKDWYIEGVSSFKPCPVHPYPPGPDGSLAAVWPPEVAAFLKDRQGEKKLAAKAPQPAPPLLHITSPAQGSVFLDTAALNARMQQIPLRAAAPSSSSVFWFVDNRYLGECRAADAMFWPLSRGHHEIACALPEGPSDKVEIVVE